MYSAIYSGIDEFQFWKMTIAEVNLRIKVFNDKRKEEQQERAGEIYTLASLVGIAYAANNPFGGGKTKFPKIHEVFPSLFEEEKPMQQDWRVAKDRLMKYAEAHNKKRGELKE